MKKYILLLLVAGSLGKLTGQYHRIAKPDRVWYSIQSGIGSNISTEILAIEGDTLINGINFPLLVLKDSSLVTTDTIAYMDEDTLAGTLRIDLFSNAEDLFYDFSLNISDTVVYDTTGIVPNKAIVDTTYTISDFRGIQRKVIEFRSLGLNSPCQNWDVYPQWIEGLGAGSLLQPLPNCNISLIPDYTLNCVFDDTVKIYGDTVQECYRQKIGLAHHELQNLKLYPNPATEVLHISSKIPLEQIRIYNLQGSLLRKISRPQKRIPISGLPAGMYIIEIRDRDGLQTTKKFRKN